MRSPYRVGRPYIWPKVENNSVFVFACVRFGRCAFLTVCVMGCVRFRSPECVRFGLCSFWFVFVLVRVRFFHLPFYFDFSKAFDTASHHRFIGKT